MINKSEGVVINRKIEFMKMLAHENRTLSSLKKFIELNFDFKNGCNEILRSKIFLK